MTAFVLAMRVKASSWGVEAIAIGREIRAHLDLLTHEYIRRGLSSEDAYAAARRAFAVLSRRRKCIGSARLPLIDGLVQDLDMRVACCVAIQVSRRSRLHWLSHRASTAASASSMRDAAATAVPDRPAGAARAPAARHRFILFNPIFEELAADNDLASVFAARTPFLKVIFDMRSRRMCAQPVRQYFSVLGVSPH